jgi:hypothetical protein
MLHQALKNKLRFFRKPLFGAVFCVFDRRFIFFIFSVNFVLTINKKFMNKLKIKSETREAYHDAGIKTLKVLIFLTKCVKNLHTDATLFIGLSIAPFLVSLYMYFSGNAGFFIFPAAMIVHFIVFKVVKLWSDNDGMKETYEEQQTIQEELEAILIEKKQ